MFKFNMHLFDNFAMFRDGNHVIMVESFNNKTFDVRYGTVTHTRQIACIDARDSNELNDKLNEIVTDYMNIKK